MLIIPALLELTTEALIARIKQAEALGCPHVHLDIMDGELVPTRTQIDAIKIAALKTNLKFELHLMVNDPVAEMRNWQIAEQVFRVLFHKEAPIDPLRPISFARKEGWDIGMVINPDTALNEVEMYFPKLDVLQFMTVYPGKQGAPFQPQVLKKIKAFTRSFPSPRGEGQGVRARPLCSVDGAVGPATILSLKQAGVEIFNCGSSLTRAKDMKQAYEELAKMINVKS